MIRLVHLLNLDMPVIPIHVNAFHEPAPTPARCFRIGQTIKEIVETTTPKDYRIAVVGSGGLSHASHGWLSNVGWIDPDHDRWVVDRLRAGDCISLAEQTNAELEHHADEELRNWICGIGFVGDREPDFLDYVLSYHSLVGNGFAAWQLT